MSQPTQGEGKHWTHLLEKVVRYECLLTLQDYFHSFRDGDYLTAIRQVMLLHIFLLRIQKPLHTHKLWMTSFSITIIGWIIMDSVHVACA